MLHGPAFLAFVGPFSQGLFRRCIELEVDIEEGVSVRTWGPLEADSLCQMRVSENPYPVSLPSQSYQDVVLEPGKGE